MTVNQKLFTKQFTVLTESSLYGGVALILRMAGSAADAKERETADEILGIMLLVLLLISQIVFREFRIPCSPSSADHLMEMRNKRLLELE